MISRLIILDSNRQWRLVFYPEGMPSESDWEMSASPIPEPGDGEMLVRAIYLDVAPYMRARISPQKNYAAGVGPGDVMLGGAIGSGFWGLLFAIRSSRAGAISE